MVKNTAWNLLKKYFILSLVSAFVIKLSGGNGWVGYSEFVVMNLLIIYMDHKPIKKMILEFIEEYSQKNRLS